MQKMNWNIKRNLPKLIRFGMVGSVGAGINFAAYYFAFEYAHFGVNLSAVTAFCIAVINNYVLNHIWTFRAENGSRTVNLRQFAYYLVGNIQGLMINLVILNLVVMAAGEQYHFFGQALGIMFGMLSNFIFAKKLVFKNSDGGAQIEAK
jgi:putative flippase GtrA